MGQDETRNEGVSIYIPRKTAAAMLPVVFAGVLGGISYPAVNWIGGYRPSAFTSQDGAELKRQIDELRHELEEHRKASEAWKYRIIGLEQREKK